MSISTKRMSIKQIIQGSCIALCFCFLLGKAYAAEDAAAQSLSVLLSNYHTLKANFSQKTLDVAGQVLENTRGDIAFQRPDLFRWYTLTPTKQLIINRGDKLAIYDVDLEQVMYKNVDEQYGATPALLLSGNVEKLQQQYDIKACPNAVEGCYQLFAKDDNDVFKQLTITFKNNVLDTMVIDNNLDQSTHITFNKVKINSQLPSSLFDLNLPAGVDVVQ